MKITQVANPFTASFSNPGKGFLTLILVVGAIFGVVYFLYTTKRLEYIDGKWSFNFNSSGQ